MSDNNSSNNSEKEKKEGRGGRVGHSFFFNYLLKYLDKQN